MPARVAIRRLELRGLAPRDHPAPGDLQRRLIDAARSHLPGALEAAVQSWTGEAVLRIKRLELDVTLDAAFEPLDFAALLARSIATALRRAGEAGADDGVVCYASRAIYLAALLEALAEGRAADRWWLHDTDGLRFLTPAQAIRTAASADPRVGLEALASLPPLKRMVVLRALTPIEAERLLTELARETGAADAAQCAQAVRRAASELPHGASALAVYVEAFARSPALAGARLAAASRLWSGIGPAERPGVAGVATLRPEGEPATAAQRPSDAPADAARPTYLDHPPQEDARQNPDAPGSAPDRPPASKPLYRFTPFGGLLLLLPDLGTRDIAAAASACLAAPNDAAALVAYAALGLCAGRDRFAEYLADGLWRELFGLDPRSPVSAIADRLCGSDGTLWSAVQPLAAPLDRRRDARFLLPPRDLVGARAASHALAGLARAATQRFARRLPGFADASACFLWTRVLATSAALERRPSGWSARLSRAPLDVLLSLGRAGEGSVEAPCGGRIDIARSSE